MGKIISLDRDRIGSRIRHVRCSYTFNGVKHTYVRVAYGNTEEEALNETYAVSIWAKHPSFRAEVIEKA